MQGLERRARSVRHLSYGAAVKDEQRIRRFVGAQIVLAAVLVGVFSALYAKRRPAVSPWSGRTGSTSSAR
jgi:hypothetical protein